MNTSNYMTTNIGSLRNYGLEVTLGARPVQTENFTWTSNLNVAWNRNKITALTGSASTDEITARNLPSGTGGALQWHLVDEAAFTYRVYQQVYDNDGNPIPGQYVDQNADGKIGGNDLINYHSPEPKVTLNWNNNFSYKNWGPLLRPPRQLRQLRLQRRAIPARTLPLCTSTASTTCSATSLSSRPTPSSSVSATIGWRTLHSCVATTSHSATHTGLIDDQLRLRLYGAVQNPFVITKYKGLDPEVFGGIDNNVYPRPVSFTIGLIATF